MRTKWLAVALSAGALTVGCGSDDGSSDSGTAQTAKRDKPAAEIDVNKDPRAITCRDLEDKEASARMSRTATYTLADEVLAQRPKLMRKTNRNLLAQQIFAGMVEVCGKQGGSHRPADAAVEWAVSRL